MFSCFCSEKTSAISEFQKYTSITSTFVSSATTVATFILTNDIQRWIYNLRVSISITVGDDMTVVK